MPLIPIYVQNELDSGDTDLAKRLSAFNFCNPYDYVLPFTDGSVSAADRQHLWGLYSGILADAPVPLLDATRASAFNFCDPFDHILPPSDGVVSALDRQHLWGMYIGIAAGPVVPVVPDEGSSVYYMRYIRQGRR